MCKSETLKRYVINKFQLLLQVHHGIVRSVLSKLTLVKNVKVLLRSQTSIVKTRHTATWPSSGGSLNPMRHMYCTPPLPGAMPCLLREQASRCYHRFACLVLTIEVYAKMHSRSSNPPTQNVFINIVMHYVKTKHAEHDFIAKTIFIVHKRKKYHQAPG